jgi:retinol dehydrogenase-12
VYIAARSQEKSQKAIDELKKETGNESVFFLKLDLSDLFAIKAAAEEFVDKESELHVLYNNAYVPHAFCRENFHILMSLSGVMYTPVDKVTEQGYDMQFGTNVLGVCPVVT